VEETAAAVTAAGAGQGVGIVCDHRDDAAVAAVAARIQDERGCLDLLVNNAWAGYERLNAGAYDEYIAPFWRQPVVLFDSMFSGGVRSHYVALTASAPLLISTPGSLTVLVSNAITDDGLASANVAYAAAKAADDKIAFVAAAQLRQHGVTSVAVYPDWVRTEGVMQFADQVNLSGSQSPEGVGRAVAALAADPDRLSLTGRALRITELAARYGVDVTS